MSGLQKGTGLVNEDFDQRDYGIEGKEVASAIKRLQALRHVYELLEILPGYLSEEPRHDARVERARKLTHITDKLKLDVEVLAA
ncbi:hypothetical protein C7271_17035, partial [filamentous cyanobacterium CCP5]